MNMTLMYLGKALAFGQKERNYMYLDGKSGNVFEWRVDKSH